MAEYIERETLLKDLEERYCLSCKDAGGDHNGCKCRACWVDDMRGDVIDAPTADVAPVRHARWVDNHCTACGMMPMGDEMWKNLDFDPPLFELFMDYCPNCGAKMDGRNYE